MRGELDGEAMWRDSTGVRVEVVDVDGVGVDGGVDWGVDWEDCVDGEDVFVVDVFVFVFVFVFVSDGIEIAGICTVTLSTACRFAVALGLGAETGAEAEALVSVKLDTSVPVNSGRVACTKLTGVGVDAGVDGEPNVPHS